MHRSRPSIPADQQPAGLSRRHFLVGGVGLAAAFLVSCGGDDDGSPSTTTAPTGSSNAEGSTTAAPTATPATTRGFDGAWGPVTVPVAPEQVVTIGTAITATMLALGLRPAGAALGNFAGVDYMADRLDGIADVGAASVLEVNREAVLALGPDLVLAHGFEFQKEAIAELNRAVPTVGLVTGYTELEDTFAFWRAVGDVCGDPAAADALVVDFQARLDDVASRLGTAMTDKPISIVRIGTDGYGLRTGSIESSIPRALGVPRPANQQDSSSTGFDVSLENIDQLDAWAIFVMTDAGAEDAQATLTGNPLWSNLPAVSAGRVFFVDGSAWNAYDPFAAEIIVDDLDRYLTEALAAG